MSNFDVKEVVYAKSGACYYKAVILENRVVDGKTEYKIHYSGWSSHHDEWVATARLMKDTPQNQALAKKVYQEALKSAASKKQSSKKGKKSKKSNSSKDEDDEESEDSDSDHEDRKERKKLRSKSTSKAGKDRKSGSSGSERRAKSSTRRAEKRTAKGNEKDEESSTRSRASGRSRRALRRGGDAEDDLKNYESRVPKGFLKEILLPVLKDHFLNDMLKTTMKGETIKSPCSPNVREILCSYIIDRVIKDFDGKILEAGEVLNFSDEVEKYFNVFLVQFLVFKEEEATIQKVEGEVKENQLQLAKSELPKKTLGQMANDWLEAHGDADSAVQYLRALREAAQKASAEWEVEPAAASSSSSSSASPSAAAASSPSSSSSSSSSASPSSSSPSAAATTTTPSASSSSSSSSSPSSAALLSGGDVTVNVPSTVSTFAEFFGAEHLLRLMVKLPSLIDRMEDLNDQKIKDDIKRNLAKLAEFMGKHNGLLFGESL